MLVRPHDQNAPDQIAKAHHGKMIQDVAEQPDDMITCDLTWSHLGVEPVELAQVSESHKVFQHLIVAVPITLERKVGDKNEWVVVSIN